ncbi:MAG: hypothetical protein Q8940_21525 [Bacteroidota bacterium]|nr:hypothetical protein [Bacteroidota bacterium]
MKLKSGRIKLTQTGNLPPNIIKEIYAKGYFPERWIEDGFVKIRTETDWAIIHNVKLVMVLAGLTKKANNWLSLTKKGETLLKNDNITEIFLEFLKAFTTKFSWAYNDGFQDEKLGQIGFLYSLFLLNKYGDKEKAFKFYADKYFLAFPSFIEFSVEDETMLGPAYYTRFFERFALWFGFVEVKIKEEKTQEDILFPERVKMLKSTELLNSMLKVK